MNTTIKREIKNTNLIILQEYDLGKGMLSFTLMKKEEDKLLNVSEKCYFSDLILAEAINGKETEDEKNKALLNLINKRI